MNDLLYIHKRQYFTRHWLLCVGCLDERTAEMLSRDNEYPKMEGESEVERGWNLDPADVTSMAGGVRRCIPARALTRYIQTTNLLIRVWTISSSWRRHQP